MINGTNHNNGTTSPNKTLNLFTDLASSSPFYAHYLTQMQQHQERLLAAARFHFQQQQQQQQQIKQLPHKRSPSNQSFHPNKPNTSAYYAMNNYQSSFNRFPSTSVDPSNAARSGLDVFSKSHFSVHHNFQTSFPMSDQTQQSQHYGHSQPVRVGHHPTSTFSLANPSETFSQTLAQMSHNQQHFQQHLHLHQLRQHSPNQSAGLFSRPYPPPGKTTSPYKSSPNSTLMSYPQFQRFSHDDKSMKEQTIKSKSPTFKSHKFHPYSQSSRIVDSPLKCEPIEDDVDKMRNVFEDSKNDRTSKMAKNEKFESSSGARPTKDFNDNHLLQAPASTNANDDAYLIKYETSDANQSAKISSNYFKSDQKATEANRLEAKLDNFSKSDSDKATIRTEPNYSAYSGFISTNQEAPLTSRDVEDFECSPYTDGRCKSTDDDAPRKMEHKVERSSQRSEDDSVWTEENSSLQPACPDSHFVRGTLVHLGDGRSKKIEQLKIEDFMNCQIPVQTNQLNPGMKSHSKNKTKPNKSTLAGNISIKDGDHTYDDGDDKTRDKDEDDGNDDDGGDANGDNDGDDVDDDEMKRDNDDEMRDIGGSLVVDTSKVIYMKENHEAGTVVLGLSVGKKQIQISIETSTDHPFFCLKQGWSSCDPNKTLTAYRLPCQPLSVGDVCVALVNHRPDTPPSPPSTDVTAHHQHCITLTSNPSDFSSFQSNTQSRDSMKSTEKKENL